MRYAALALALASISLGGCSSLTEPDEITIYREPPPAPVPAAAPAGPPGGVAQPLRAVQQMGAPRSGG